MDVLTKGRVYTVKLRVVYKTKIILINHKDWREKGEKSVDLYISTVNFTGNLSSG
jgi:hypothetical protein